MKISKLLLIPLLFFMGTPTGLVNSPTKLRRMLDVIAHRGGSVDATLKNMLTPTVKAPQQKPAQPIYPWDRAQSQDIIKRQGGLNEILTAIQQKKQYIFKYISNVLPAILNNVNQEPNLQNTAPWCLHHLLEWNKAAPFLLASHYNNIIAVLETAAHTQYIINRSQDESLINFLLYSPQLLPAEYRPKIANIINYLAKNQTITQNIRIKIQPIVTPVTQAPPKPQDTQIQLNLPKLEPAINTVYDIVSRYAIGTKNYYFDDGMGLSVPNPQFSLFAQIPGIGFYTTPYYYNNRILVLHMTNDMLRYAPQIVKDNIQEIKNIDLYTVITGAIIHIQEKTPEFEQIRQNIKTHGYNLLFHGFLATKYPHSGGFNEPLKMGVFDPIGITPIDIPCNEQLTEQKGLSVHCHDNAFSPDNAHFKFSDGFNAATFWTVAILPKMPQPQSRAAVTYHLIIQDPVLEQQIANGFTNSSQGFLAGVNNIRKLAEQQDINTKKALHNFADTMDALMGKGK